MGICSSTKKTVPNGNYFGKNNTKKTIPNGLLKSPMASSRRKSVKLQEFDRVSNITIMDGNFTNFIFRYKKFLSHGHKQPTS